MARADQIGHIDCHGWFACVRHEEDTQAIREAVFGDSFNAGDLRHAFRECL